MPQDAPKLTDEQVAHVAKLSRLALDDEQTHHFAQQLGDVLGYIAKLSELDVEGVEPLSHAVDVTNVLREDVAKPGMATDAALTNAPARHDDFFKVPKVIGDGGGA